MTFNISKFIKLGFYEHSPLFALIFSISFSELVAIYLHVLLISVFIQAADIVRAYFDSWIYFIDRKFLIIINFFYDRGGFVFLLCYLKNN